MSRHSSWGLYTAVGIVPIAAVGIMVFILSGRSMPSGSGPIRAERRDPLGRDRIGGIADHLGFREYRRDLDSAGSRPDRSDGPQLADRITILAVEVDAKNPYASTVTLVLVSVGAEPQVLRVGDRIEGILPAAVLRRVESDAVHFEWGDTDQVIRYRDAGRNRGEDATSSAAPDASPAQSAARAPEATYFDESQKTWHISLKEQAIVERDHERMLREDVALAPFMVPGAQRSEGLLVCRVAEGSLAYQRGLREGDIIRMINDCPATSQAAVIRYLRQHPSSGLYRVLIERLGRIEEIRLRLY